MGVCTDIDVILTVFHATFMCDHAPTQAERRGKQGSIESMCGICVHGEFGHDCYQ